MARAAGAKLEQIKELYLTAEAIGEDALVRHFDEVSQRQRDLIGEYFKLPGRRPSTILPPPDSSLPPQASPPPDGRPARAG
jgi:hypothetical protein